MAVPNGALLNNTDNVRRGSAVLRHPLRGVGTEAHAEALKAPSTAPEGKSHMACPPARDALDGGGGGAGLRRPAYAQPLSPGRQVSASMAFVTDSNRPQPLWQPPAIACLTASGAASKVPSLLMHPWPQPLMGEPAQCSPPSARRWGCFGRSAPQPKVLQGPPPRGQQNARCRDGLLPDKNGQRTTLNGTMPPPPPPIWMHLVNGTGNSTSLGRPTPGVVQQDKSSGGSVGTTKPRSDPQGVGMREGERPIGGAKGKQTNTMACPPPPPVPPEGSLHRISFLCPLSPPLRPPPPYHPFGTVLIP